mmetsp:Transcript_17936/g.27726  ORF Transcript_17936/g.27726 Transcript_17936/m.27726 type:complete len:204 (+) Transcript_17936:136-747(+)
MCSSLHVGTNLNRVGAVNEVGKLIEVQVPVRIGSSGIDRVHVLHVFFDSWQLSFDSSDGCEFGTGQEDICALSQSVREVTSTGGHRGTSRGNTCLVSHAQTASWHFRTGSGSSKNTVVSFIGELGFVHLGWGSNPQTSRDWVFQLAQQFSGSAEVSNIGHARSNEHLVNLGSSIFTQQRGCVGIIGKCQHGLLKFVQVDVDNS